MDMDKTLVVRIDYLVNFPQQEQISFKIIFSCQLEGKGLFAAGHLCKCIQGDLQNLGIKMLETCFSQ